MPDILGGIAFALAWLMFVFGLPFLFVFGICLNLRAWAEERDKRRAKSSPAEPPPDGVWPPPPDGVWPPPPDDPTA